MSTADGAALLRHLRVTVATHVRPAAAGAHATTSAHLPGVLSCVRSWASLKVIESAALTVYTNDLNAVQPLLHSIDWSAAPSWTARATKPNLHGHPFDLVHAHLHEWAAIVAEPTSAATAFVHLEDDVCPSSEALAAWADDEGLLIRSGVAAAGFQRGLYRYEVTRRGEDMPPPPPGRYSAEFINRRAAEWRAAHGVALGERLVVDELRRRAFSPVWPRPCDTRPPCDAPSSAPSWCASFPIVAVRGAGQSPSRVFVALKNPYSAMTLASRQLVSDFLLRSNGWNRSMPSAMSAAKRGAAASNATAAPPVAAAGRAPTPAPTALAAVRRARFSPRTRHRAYGVREYGSCTFHYAIDFLPFLPARGWPELIRRVLVPLRLVPFNGTAGTKAEAKHAHWQLDPVAAVHHRSDRMANGPRKFQEQFQATLREREVVVCRRASAPSTKTKSGSSSAGVAS